MLTIIYNHFAVYATGVRLANRMAQAGRGGEGGIKSLQSLGLDRRRQSCVYTREISIGGCYGTR
jgi:hypothetical protein